jgi:glycosyltransferase involved in cell wall biosynthesis
MFLAHATARLAPRPSAAPRAADGGIVIGGEVRQAAGLGEAARLLNAGTRALGLKTWLVQAGLGVAGDRADEGLTPDDLADAAPGAPLILCVNAPQLPAALLRLPRAALRDRRIIGFWNWELPVLPKTWRPAMDLVHEIWVPSRFTADAFAAAMKPGAPAVRVVPYPVAIAPPHPAMLSRADFGLPEGAVIVLASFNLASSFARKNPLGAIAAFRAAFGDRADRVLVLKIGGTAHYAADLAAIFAATDGAANICIETKPFSSGARHALTACADIVLSLHRSEGFGLVPAEAMLLGKAVVATGWSGNLDFMDETCAALVGFRLVGADDPRGTYQVRGAMWAEPDIAEAAAHLARLADDPAERRLLGARAKGRAAEALGVSGLAHGLAALGATGTKDPRRRCAS